MSPRAACRLETLGFTEVYDYVAGKTEWAAYGLPVEGKKASSPRTANVAVRDVPTVGPKDALRTVKQRMERDGRGVAVVVVGDAIVVGTVGPRGLEGDLGAPVESVMSPGPSTYRPDVELAELVPKLKEQDVNRVVITTPDGRYAGVLFRADAEKLLGQQQP